MGYSDGGGDGKSGKGTRWERGMGEGNGERGRSGMEVKKGEGGEVEKWEGGMHRHWKRGGGGGIFCYFFESERALPPFMV